MQFSSFAEFIAMGGHGFYVWLSFGISGLLLSLLVLTSLWRQRALISELQAKQRREQKLKQAAKLAQASASDDS